MKTSATLATTDASRGATPTVLRALAAETDRIVTSGTQRYSRYGLMFDTRYALWAGQNDEGTKEAEDAFPWPGASDTRVRLADRVIREQNVLRKAALYGKRLQARPLRGVNQGAATLVNTLVKWMLYTVALPMFHRETQLGWSYAGTYGAAVMGCFWKRRTRLEPHRIDLAELMQIARQTQDPQLVRMLIQLADPLQDPATVEAMAGRFPDNTAATLAAAVRSLRETGFAEIRSAYLCKNELRWLAMRPGIDVFFDAALDDLQEAPLITVREMLSEADVREREASEGWDPDFIDQAVQKAGESSFDAAVDPLRLSPRGSIGRAGVMAEDWSQRIEILTSFYFVHEKGTSALYQTIYHRGVGDVAAYHELHSYDHGEMPFFPVRSETTERPILESRGIPEICMTWQTEEKVERDAWTDRQGLEILPTLLTPRGRAGQVLIGPGAQVEQKRANDYAFLQLPQTSPASERAGHMREKEICQYFGLFHPEADPVITQLQRQAIVTDSLTELVSLVQQSWKLMQQYLTDEEIQAVAGPQGAGLRVGRETIRGEYLFEWTYDVRVTDNDFITTVIAAIKEILPMDRLGTIDLNGIVGFLLHSISPDLAEQFVRPAQAAQMQDVTDELSQLGQIAVGIEPPMRPVSNPQLRLQVLQQVMQSPRYQQVVAGDQTGIVQKLLENQHAKYQFAIQQQVNAQTGLMGVEPVLGTEDGLPQPGQPAQPPRPPGLGMGEAAAHGTNGGRRMGEQPMPQPAMTGGAQ